MKFTVYAEIDIPRVPNFLRFANGEGTLSVGDITDASLHQIGVQWTEALLKRAEEIRCAPRPSEDDSEVSR